jgi:hypothetical protein
VAGRRQSPRLETRKARVRGVGRGTAGSLAVRHVDLYSLMAVILKIKPAKTDGSCRFARSYSPPGELCRNEVSLESEN